MVKSYCSFSFDPELNSLEQINLITFFQLFTFCRHYPDFAPVVHLHVRTKLHLLKVTNSFFEFLTVCFEWWGFLIKTNHNHPLTSISLTNLNLLAKLLQNVEGFSICLLQGCGEGQEVSYLLLKLLQYVNLREILISEFLKTGLRV